MTGVRRTIAAVALSCLAGCGPGGAGVPPDSPAVEMLTIINYTYTPLRITAVPGGAVLVRNWDTFAHTVTSAASSGSFVFGAVNGVRFDTGQFLGDRVFTLPADAPVGTIVPCFCALHPGLSGEAGEVEVVAPFPTSP